MSHGQQRDKRRLRLLELDLDGVLVKNLDAYHVLGLAVDHVLVANDIGQVALAPVGDFRPVRVIEGELDVLGDHFGAGVELDSLAQLDRVEAPIF